MARPKAANEVTADAAEAPVTDCPMEPRSSGLDVRDLTDAEIDGLVMQAAATPASTCRNEYGDYQMRLQALLQASAYAIESIKQRGAHDVVDTVIKRADAYLAFLRGE